MTLLGVEYGPRFGDTAHSYYSDRLLKRPSGGLAVATVNLGLFADIRDPNGNVWKYRRVFYVQLSLLRTVYVYYNREREIFKRGNNARSENECIATAMTNVDGEPE